MLGLKNVNKRRYHIKPYQERFDRKGYKNNLVSD